MVTVQDLESQGHKIIRTQDIGSNEILVTTLPPNARIGEEKQFYIKSGTVERTGGFVSEEEARLPSSDPALRKTQDIIARGAYSRSKRLVQPKQTVTALSSGGLSVRTQRPSVVPEVEVVENGKKRKVSGVLPATDTFAIGQRYTATPFDIKPGTYITATPKPAAAAKLVTTKGGVISKAKEYVYPQLRETAKLGKYIIETPFKAGGRAMDVGLGGLIKTEAKLEKYKPYKSFVDVVQPRRIKSKQLFDITSTKEKMVSMGMPITASILPTKMTYGETFFTGSKLYVYGSGLIKGFAALPKVVQTGVSSYFTYRNIKAGMKAETTEGKVLSYGGAALSSIPLVTRGYSFFKRQYDIRYSKSYIPQGEMFDYVKGTTIPAKLKDLRTVEGKTIGTTHATMFKGMDVGKQGPVLLKGIPAEAAGLRSEFDLYGFYRSARPYYSVTDVYGSKYLLNRPAAYLGYIGITEAGYKGPSKPLKFTLLKPKNLLLTEDVLITKTPKLKGGIIATRDWQFKQPGKTFVGAENIFGKSTEGQVVTSSAYTTKTGVEFPGSMIISDPKGFKGFTYFAQTKEAPSLIAKSPLLTKGWDFLTTEQHKISFVPIKTLPAVTYGGKTYAGTISKAGEIKSFTTVSTTAEKSYASFSYKQPYVMPLYSPSVPSVPSSTPFKSPKITSTPSRSVPKSSSSSFSPSKVYPSSSSSISKISSPSYPSSPYSPSSPSYPSSPSSPSIPSSPSSPASPSYPSSPLSPSSPSSPRSPSSSYSYSIPKTPGSPPITLPKLRGSPFGPRKSTRGGRRSFAYKPSLVGIFSGKTISKAPKGTLSGLGIRSPVRRKKKKKRKGLFNLGY